MRRPILQSFRYYAALDKSNPTRAKELKFVDRNDEALKYLQNWLQHFNQKKFPREICKVSFSRSSGPGGQNVNKYIPMFGGADLD